MKLKNGVTEVSPADPERALQHFSRKFEFETDCWDVHAALELADSGFYLLDVRSHELFEEGHVRDAVNLPNWQVTAKRMEAFDAQRMCVVYCAGPHCNGADKAAARLAEMGWPVKVMIGGVCGWLDEGFELVKS